MIEFKKLETDEARDQFKEEHYIKMLIYFNKWIGTFINFNKQV